MSIRRFAPAVVCAALLAATVAVVGAPVAGALTAYTVTSTVDGDPGSLRDVLDQANADGDDSVIQLPAGAELVLDVCALPTEDANASGDLDSTDGAHDLTIEGNGATIRQTCDEERVFHAFNDGSIVTFRQVTITGGDVVSATRNGGGISVAGPGDLSVVLSTIVGNTAANVGGGIAATDIGVDTVRVFIADSTISGNTAEGSSGGGLFTLGTNTIVNSTFSGNMAGRISGAIVGDTDLTYATIVDNGTETNGGGSQLDLGSLTSFASVIADSRGPGQSCVLSSASSGGFNVDDDGSCFSGPQDATVADVLVGPLADNGGQTLTHLPQPGSPLLDRWTSVPCHPTYVADQRNVARPQGPGCDTGSVEVVVDAPPTTGSTASSAPPTTSPGTAAVPVSATPSFTG